MDPLHGHAHARTRTRTHKPTHARARTLSVPLVTGALSASRVSLPLSGASPLAPLLLPAVADLNAPLLPTVFSFTSSFFSFQVLGHSSPSTKFKNCSSILIPFFFFFGGTGVEIQGFALAKQELYHLSHTSGPFALVILEMGSWKLFAWTSLKPQSS
jgi:hypothetical protein